MSPQVKQFRELIARVQRDHEDAEAVRLVRAVCSSLPNAAPVPDLIEIALFLADVGERVANEQLESN